MRDPLFIFALVFMPLIGCGQQTGEDLAADDLAGHSFNGTSGQPADTDVAEEPVLPADPVQQADAEIILSEGLALAGKDDKRLLVHLGAPG